MCKKAVHVKTPGMCGPALEKDPCPLQVFLMDLITAETCDRA